MPRIQLMPEWDDPATRDCDVSACEHMEVALRAYHVVQPTHSHAHYMNEDPCGYCDHGNRYHMGDKCSVEDCDCMGHQ